jgi:5-formyltetrahydrofolate cyclo-ligase
MEPSANGKDLKQAIRQQAQANRREQVDKDAVSRMIWQRLASLPEYVRSVTVMGYVHMRDEVRTRSFLPEILKHGKRLVVPYCVGDELALFCLRDLDELALSTFGILEPKPKLQAQADRRIDVGQIDLVMVPGVAFDRRGGRVGHGKGYYDRLLRRARPDTALIGLAFECQLFAEIPMQPHDVFMDKVITETAVYEGRGRKV